MGWVEYPWLVGLIRSDLGQLSVSPQAESYEPGDTARVQVYIEGFTCSDVAVQVEIALRSPSGKLFSPDRVLPLPKSATVSHTRDLALTVEWEIPTSATLGAYEIRPLVWQTYALPHQAESAQQWQHAFDVVGAWEPSYDPTATVLIMDVSGSMKDPWKGERKIDAARRAALDFIEHVAQEARARAMDHRIGVVAFSDSAQVLLPLTNDYDRARQTVIALKPGAFTNIGDGLVEGLKQLAQMRSGQRFVILLSDGMRNRGMSESGILSGPVAHARKDGVCIHTVGFGDGRDINETFLKRVASESGCGTYGHAETPTQLFYTYVRARHTALGNIVGEYSAINRKVVMLPNMASALGTLVLLGQEDELHYTLAWSEDGAMSVQLRDPAGQVHDASDPDVVAYSGERFSYMMVPSPERGVWTVEAVPDVNIDEESEYYAVVSTRPAGSAIAVALPALRIGDWEIAVPAGLPGWILLVATAAFVALQLYQRTR